MTQIPCADNVLSLLLQAKSTRMLPSTRNSSSDPLMVAVESTGGEWRLLKAYWPAAGKIEWGCYWHDRPAFNSYEELLESIAVNSKLPNDPAHPDCLLEPYRSLRGNRLR